MRHFLQENMIPALWIAFALYWVLAAIRQKHAKHDKSDLSRLFYVAVVVVCVPSPPDLFGDARRHFRYYASARSMARFGSFGDFSRRLVHQSEERGILATARIRRSIRRVRPEHRVPPAPFNTLSHQLIGRGRLLTGHGILVAYREGSCWRSLFG